MRLGFVVKVWKRAFIFEPGVWWYLRQTYCWRNTALASVVTSYVFQGAHLDWPVYTLIVWMVVSHRTYLDSGYYRCVFPCCTHLCASYQPKH